MNIIFMGSCDFAAIFLKKLISINNINILSIYSKKLYSKRGNKVISSEIDILADKFNINNIKINKFQQEDINKIHQINYHQNIDIIFVVSYGIFLPKDILSLPKYGCVNIHPSDLPKYRGAAPIQRAIINREKEIAISLIKMTKDLDTGDIIYKEKIDLDDNLSYLEVKFLLANLFIIKIEKILFDYINDIIRPYSQLKDNKYQISYANKIEKSESKIDFNDYAKNIKAKINALNGDIGAYFIYKNKRIKLFKIEIIPYKEDNNLNIGDIKIDYKENKLLIACKDGFISILILQQESCQKMTIDKFINGKNI